MRAAKIVCTLGPASDDRGTIEELAEAGMSVARLNASHADPDELATLADTVRAVDVDTDAPLATILDLQGPEIRTTPPASPVGLTAGTIVTFLPDASTTDEVIGVSRPLAGVQVDDDVLVDDGRIAFTVTDVSGEGIEARVEDDGTLQDRQGINVPGVDLDLPAVTDSDREDLAVLTEDTIDFVAASFVRDADDVLAVNGAIEALECDVPVIAKIERADAVTNLSGIIDAADGVMVARGDLGVECPMEDVPMIQKRIIRRCHTAGVPVITATEMLDSMVSSRRPTRAEASDVANAVLDGTDAVMLSGETAIGDDPVHVVETMARIVREVERSEEYAELREQRVPPAAGSRTDALARAGRYLARDVGAATVIATTESGYTARTMATYRPGVPIVAVTRSDRVSRRLALTWGLHPRRIEPAQGTATALIEDAIAATVDEGIVSAGDTVVVIAGMMQDLAGAEFTNSLTIHVAAETLATGRVVVSGRASGPLTRVPDGDLADVPDGAILVVGREFEGPFAGTVDRIGGIVSAARGLTGYPAMIARELEIPMIGGTTVPESVASGTTVTLDAERGVLYDGNIASPRLLDERTMASADRDG